MMPPSHGAAAERLVIWGAVATIIGLTASGPLGLLGVMLVHPQPAWTSAQAFAEQFHPIQTLPFFASFIHAVGYLVLMAALYQCADNRLKTRAMTALALTTLFATLVSFSYICQTTFIPALVHANDPDNDIAIAMLSMSNPRSLCWGIEMWGYGFLGLATWFVAPVLHRDPLERITAWLFVANGVISIAGAILTAVDLTWVMSPAGMYSYVAWNVLILLMSVLLIIIFVRRRRTRAATEEGLGSRHGHRVSADSD
jgi:hypothetical protein